MLQPLLRADGIELNAVLLSGFADDSVHNVDIVGTGGNHGQFVIQPAQV